MFLPFDTNLLCMYVCSVAVEYTTYKPCCQVNYEKILNFTSERYSHSLTLSCMRLDFSSQTAYNRVANENKGVHSYHQEQQETPYGTVHTEGVFCSLGVSACRPWTAHQATCKCNELPHLLRRTVQTKALYSFISPPPPFYGVGHSSP